MFVTWRVTVDLSRRNLLDGVCPFLTWHIVSFHLKQVESASAAEARAAESWLKPWWENFFGPPSKGDRLTNLTLNRKDWLSVAQWLGVCLKKLTCTLDGWYYRERQKHGRQSRAPGPFRNARPRYSVPASSLFGRHWPWHQPPLNYTSPASFYKHVRDVAILITPYNIHYICTCIHVLGQ
jgi:hypothetical protein